MVAQRFKHLQPTGNHWVPKSLHATSQAPSQRSLAFPYNSKTCNSLCIFKIVFFKCLLCQQPMWKPSLQLFAPAAVPSAELHSLLEGPQCLVLCRMVWYSMSVRWDVFLLCVWVPGPLLRLMLWVWVAHSTHFMAPCSTSWYWLLKGILQLNCCRSLGTDVSSLQHELALPRAPPPPYPCVSAFCFGYTGVWMHRQSWQKTWNPNIPYTGRHRNKTHLLSGRLLPSSLCHCHLLRPAIKLDLLLLQDISLPLGL